MFQTHGKHCDFCWLSQFAAAIKRLRPSRHNIVALTTVGDDDPRACEWSDPELHDGCVLRFALVVKVISRRVQLSVCEHARQVPKEGVSRRMMVRDARNSRSWYECSAQQVNDGNNQSRIDDSVHDGRRELTVASWSPAVVAPLIYA